MTGRCAHTDKQADRHTGALKMQDMKMKDQTARHENAGQENAGPGRNPDTL